MAEKNRTASFRKSLQTRDFTLQNDSRLGQTENSSTFLHTVEFLQLSRKKHSRLLRCKVIEKKKKQTHCQSRRFALQNESKLREVIILFLTCRQFFIVTVVFLAAYSHAYAILKIRIYVKRG